MGWPCCVVSLGGWLVCVPKVVGVCVYDFFALVPWVMESVRATKTWMVDIGWRKSLLYCAMTLVQHYVRRAQGLPEGARCKKKGLAAWVGRWRGQMGCKSKILEQETARPSGGGREGPFTGREAQEGAGSGT